jgi:hypothetical protein
MNNNINLPELSYQAFLTYQEVTDFVKSLASVYPDMCQLGSIGKSREGREIYLLTITNFTSGDPKDKPAYLIHGNIHATELAGTHTSLYTAKQLLIDESVRDLLQEVVFYIIPRINPDGAEYVATTSGPIRSRTDRSILESNTLYPKDMNGDGLILTMRQEHPNGTAISDPDDPRLLIRRKTNSKGPFYRLIPEGEIHNWDGSDNISIDGRGFDWNRNWSYDWRPEPEQYGAGDFPFSETEMRCMAEFIHSSPNLFAVLGYHTGPSAVLRPPSTGSDSDLDEYDVRIMDDLAQFGSESTGFPVIPVVKYHGVRSRDINLRGHFHDFGYHHLGLYVFEFELGVIQNSAGISTEEQLAVKNDDEEAEQLRKVMQWWDNQTQKEPLFKNWEAFDHPQFGKVEIGGFIRRHAYNPALSDLAKISEGTYKFTINHALKHPKIILEDVKADNVGGNLFRIRVRIANRGEFPTHVSNKGRSLRRLRPVRVELYTSEGIELLSNQGHYNLGHLGGITDSRLLEWFVSVSDTNLGICQLKILGGTGGNICQTIKLK